jgi:hypothetical protein
VEIAIDYEGVPRSGTIGSSILFEPGDIRLPPDSFWYPGDAQSFFSANVSVTVPRGMTVVHNGEQREDAGRGKLHAVRWRTTRPIGGMALVAGTYEETSLEADAIRYRLYTAPGERLDVVRTIAAMAEADSILRSKLGPHGFPQLTAFVTRRLRRAFNDGSGTVALSNRYFRDGDYAFGLIAHELAHNWWGGTVAEKWLDPGTGGEWLVEGFAEFSSIVASETKFGAAAASLRRRAVFFDPEKQRSIREMSVFDNAVAEAVSRDTIYRKGAYVALMLRQIVGEQAYFDALAQFIERFRYRQAGDEEIQTTLEELTGIDLDAYFEDWVRSDRLADLAIEKTAQGDLEVTNVGSARIAGEVTLWKVRSDAVEAEAVRVRVGDRVALEPGVDYLVLDPLLEWADVERENNRFPRQSVPIDVAVSPAGRTLAAFGAPFAWGRTQVRDVTAQADTPEVWDFGRGLAHPPAFGADGETAVVAEATAGPLAVVATLSPNGTRRIHGSGNDPVLLRDGSVVAAADDALVQWSSGREQTQLLRRAGCKLGHPAPSHDGGRIAYLSQRANDLEVRVYDTTSGIDAGVLSADGDRALLQWSADDRRLFVGLGVGWDWQIWSVPLDRSQAVEILAANIVSLRDMELSRDGEHLAFAAVPALEYPLNRGRLYVQPTGGGAVRAFEVPDGTIEAIAWEGPTSLIAVTRQWRGENPWILPATTKLQRVRLDDDSIGDF